MIRRGLKHLAAILEWPLTSNYWLQAVIALCLAALLFAPLELLPIEPHYIQGLAALAVLGALYAVLYMMVTAMLSVTASPMVGDTAPVIGGNLSGNIPDEAMRPRS